MARTLWPSLCLLAACWLLPGCGDDCGEDCATSHSFPLEGEWEAGTYEFVFIDTQGPHRCTVTVGDGSFSWTCDASGKGARLRFEPERSRFLFGATPRALTVSVFRGGEEVFADAFEPGSTPEGCDPCWQRNDIPLRASSANGG